MPKHLSAPEAASEDWPSNEERRAAVRYRVTLHASCQPLDNYAPLRQGRVRDISTLGVGLMLRCWLKIGTLLEVELQKSNGRPVRTVLARVVHAEADDSGAWLIGCAFTTELSDQELQLFNAERQRAAAPDQRRWVRFPCNVETACCTCDTAPGERRAARILNISAGGVGLILPCEFQTGTLLRLQLPRATDEPGHELLVRVVRALEHERGYWFLGCEFALQLSSDDLRALFR